MVCLLGVCVRLLRERGGCLPSEGVVFHLLGVHRPPPPRILGNTVNIRSVRILLECILVVVYFQDDKSYSPEPGSHPR